MCPCGLHITLGSRLPFFIEGRRWNEPKQTARQAERLSEVDSVSSYLYDKRATNFLPCSTWIHYTSATFILAAVWEHWSLHHDGGNILKKSIQVIIHINTVLLSTCLFHPLQPALQETERVQLGLVVVHSVQVIPPAVAPDHHETARVRRTPCIGDGQEIISW